MAKTFLRIRKKYNQATFYLTAAAAMAVGTYLLLHALASAPVMAHFVPPDHGTAFNKGEFVVFGVTDHTQQGITFTDNAPWEVVDEHNNQVFKPVAVKDFSALSVQENRYWSWDQDDQGGHQVSSGKYTIIINYQVDHKAAEAKLDLTIR